MLLILMKESYEVMSQQQSSTPKQSPNPGSSIIVWIGIMLFITMIALGIYAIVTKQDIIVSVLLFILAALALPIGIQQIAPGILPPNSRPVAIVKGSDDNFWFTEEHGNKT